MKKVQPVTIGLILTSILFIFSCEKEISQKKDTSTYSDVEMVIEPAVVDGDSIRKDIRLFGIDAPEYSQKYGKEAKSFLYNLVKDKVVICFKHSRDRYGRIVAECFADDINVNAAMVKNGYAWAYRHYSNAFNMLEDYAKKHKLGLWQDENPLPPWKYRKQKREKNNQPVQFNVKL